MALDHARVQMTGSTGGDLLHRKSEALQAGRIVFRLNVSGQHGHAGIAGKGFEGAFEERGLARSG